MKSFSRKTKIIITNRLYLLLSADRGVAMTRGRVRCGYGAKPTERERATIRVATRNVNCPVRLPARTGRARPFRREVRGEAATRGQ